MVIEKLPIINLALFIFLTILLGIELGLTINLVFFSLYAGSLATTPTIEERKTKRKKKPEDIEKIETAA